MRKQICLIIIKIFTLSLPFICMSLAVGLFPLKFMDNECAQYYQNREYAEFHEDYCRVLIIGDSLAKAGWMPDELSDDTYNFALGGLCPIEEYYYLRDYLQYNEAPEYVILTQGLERFFSLGTLWDRSVYFHRISLTEMLEVYKSARELKDEIVFSNKSLVDLMFYKIYSPTLYSTAFFKGIFTDRLKNNIASYNGVKKSRGHSFFITNNGFNGIGEIAGYDSFESSSIFDEYFRKIIELCEDNDIKIIIQSAPINKTTYENLNPEFVRGYNEYIKKIQSDYPNIVVNGELYYYDNIYFGDVHLHLNKDGAIKFSREMKKKYSNTVFK